jgi:hypothetical protein
LTNIKTITIDRFYNQDEANRLASSVYGLSYSDMEFGKEIENFSLVPPDADAIFSKVLNMKLTVDQESGTFRIPKRFIHFESFESLNDWIFVVALQESTFNIFEHKTGILDARESYKLGYMNLFEWDLTVNYILKPGQGIMFRPWLFHSFDSGLIQTFKLNEKL